MTRIAVNAGRVARASRLAAACAAIVAAAACSGDGTGAETGERTPVGSWVLESHMGQPLADSLRIEETGPGQLSGRFWFRINPRLLTLPGTYDQGNVSFTFPQFNGPVAWNGTLDPGGEVLELSLANVRSPAARYRRARATQTPVDGISYEYTITLRDGTRHEYSGRSASYMTYSTGPAADDYSTNAFVSDSMELSWKHTGQPLAPTGGVAMGSPPFNFVVVRHHGLATADLDRAASSLVVESSTQQSLRARFRMVLTSFSAGTAPVNVGTVEGTFTAVRVTTP